jgi:small neutral amino acid transporter SnatA (MarC family)
MSAVSIFNAVLNFGSVVMLAVGALLPIVDPLGGAPIYLAMTVGLTSAERSRMAKAVAINSFLLLCRFGFDRRLCARLFRCVNSVGTSRRRHRGLHDRVVLAE